MIIKASLHSTDIGSLTVSVPGTERVILPNLRLEQSVFCMISLMCDYFHINMFSVTSD